MVKKVVFAFLLEILLEKPHMGFFNPPETWHTCMKNHKMEK
jgi:hypothetical protein